jgi:hypothetical protein
MGLSVNLSRCAAGHAWLAGLGAAMFKRRA